MGRPDELTAIVGRPEGNASAEDGAAPAVALRDLRVRYRPQDDPALSGATLRVAVGESVAVVGPSGSGKSTLLRAAAGFLRAEAGEVSVLGLPASDARLRGRVGYIPQQLGLVRARSAFDNAVMGALSRTATGRSLLGVFSPLDAEVAREALAAVGLERKMHDKVSHLSGGERQRVAIARTLVQRPQLLLADEFVSNLDVAAANDVLALVGKMRDRGVTMLMAMHDLDLVAAFADRVVVLAAGRVVGDFATASLDVQQIKAVMGSRPNA